MNKFYTVLNIKIIDVYEDANVAPKSKIYDYLLKYQMRNLLSQIDKF